MEEGPATLCDRLEAIEEAFAEGYQRLHRLSFIVTAPARDEQGRRVAQMVFNLVEAGANSAREAKPLLSAVRGIFCHE